MNKKVSGPFLLYGIIAALIMFGLLVLCTSAIAGMITHGTFVTLGISPESDTVTGNAEVALAVMGLILISVGLTLLTQAIVFFMFANTIKRMVVAKIVKVAAIFNLELTPAVVWSALFAKKESPSEDVS